MTGSLKFCSMIRSIRSPADFVATTAFTFLICTVLSSSVNRICIGVFSLYPFVQTLLSEDAVEVAAKSNSLPINFKGYSKYTFPSTRCTVTKPPLAVSYFFPLNNLSYLLGSTVAFSGTFFFFLPTASAEKATGRIHSNVRLHTIHLFIHTSFKL